MLAMALPIEKGLGIDREPLSKTAAYWIKRSRGLVELRISEGCVCVEMEAAAFFAVARFRDVRLGQILYGGDDLSGETWDNRQWNDRTDIRENLVDLPIKDLP